MFKIEEMHCEEYRHVQPADVFSLILSPEGIRDVNYLYKNVCPSCMYDENGRLDKGYITTDIFSGEITSVAYSYDDKGNVITEIWEDFQGSPYKRTYHYDENGRNDYTEDSVGGKVISTHRNSFDEAGNMIAEYTYNAQNELIDHVREVLRAVD